MTAPPTRLERIAAARDGFVSRARADSEQVQAFLQDARKGDDQAVQRIRELAHRLAGTAGSFGFMNVSSAASVTLAVIEAGAKQPELAESVDRLCAEIKCMGGVAS